MFRKKYLALILALVLALLPFQAYSSGLKYIMLKINSKTAYVNMRAVQLDVAPIEINGRTLVPLRFIAENFGAKNITYYPETEEISLELEDASVLRLELSRLNELVNSLQNENKQLKGEITNLQQRIRELEGQKPPPTEPSVQPPYAPKNLQAMLSDQSVVLTWSPSAMGTYPIAGYKVFRREQNQGAISLIGVLPPSSLSYSDFKILPAQTYFYYVLSYDMGSPSLESSPSQLVSITVPAKSNDPENVPPSPPVGLMASVSGTSVNLSWKASSPGSKPLAGYKIYRSQSNSSEFTVISVLPLTRLSYIDTQILEGQSYGYFVRAYDTSYPALESSESNRVTAKMSEKKESDSTFVYVTKSGKKYHTANCKHLSSSKIQISLKEAKEKGYTPCSDCDPPR